MRIIILLFMTIVALYTKATSVDWCDYKCPDDQKNVVCDKGEKCPASEDCEEAADFTDDVREILLDGHNSYRSKVALGEEPAIPLSVRKAANMMTLSWDNELELAAKCHVMQCSFSQDAYCRKTPKYGAFGQVVAAMDIANGTCNASEFAHEVMNYWIHSTYNLTFEKDEISEDIPDYYQLIWAKTTHMGCFMSQKNNQIENKTSCLIACNYASNNLVKDESIYSQGEPCSECPEGELCHPLYEGLCGNNYGPNGNIARVLTTKKFEATTEAYLENKTKDLPEDLYQPLFHWVLKEGNETVKPKGNLSTHPGNEEIVNLKYVVFDPDGSFKIYSDKKIAADKRNLETSFWEPLDEEIRHHLLVDYFEDIVKAIEAEDLNYHETFDEGEYKIDEDISEEFEQEKKLSKEYKKSKTDEEDHLTKNRHKSSSHVKKNSGKTKNSQQKSEKKSKEKHDKRNRGKLANKKLKNNNSKNNTRHSRDVENDDSSVSSNKNKFLKIRKHEVSDNTNPSAFWRISGHDKKLALVRKSEKKQKPNARHDKYYLRHRNSKKKTTLKPLNERNTSFDLEEGLTGDEKAEDIGTTVKNNEEVKVNTIYTVDKLPLWIRSFDLRNGSDADNESKDAHLQKASFNLDNIKVLYTPNRHENKTKKHKLNRNFFVKSKKSKNVVKALDKKDKSKMKNNTGLGFEVLDFLSSGKKAKTQTQKNKLVKLLNDINNQYNLDLKILNKTELKKLVTSSTVKPSLHLNSTTSSPQNHTVSHYVTKENFTQNLEINEDERKSQNVSTVLLDVSIGSEPDSAANVTREELQTIISQEEKFANVVETSSAGVDSNDTSNPVSVTTSQVMVYDIKTEDSIITSENLNENDQMLENHGIVAENGVELHHFEDGNTKENDAKIIPNDLLGHPNFRSNATINTNKIQSGINETDFLNNTAGINVTDRTQEGTDMTNFSQSKLKNKTVFTRTSLDSTSYSTVLVNVKTIKNLQIKSRPPAKEYLQDDENPGLFKRFWRDLRAFI